ncbi:MAG TPA: precorrin-3B synthase [Jatrophihabitans sp.]
MGQSATQIRSGRDRCPGVLEAHQAADGGLVRIRIPGGRLTGEQWHGLATLAATLGDGDLYLTSRGNIQLRGLRSGAERELSEGLFTLGLFPSASHERVRNIAASPLTGLDTLSVLDLRPIIAELDSQLCQRTRLAALSGRFLFGLDDGRGDVAALVPDICARAVTLTSLTLIIAGLDTGIRLGADAIVGAMLDAAEVFLRRRAEQGLQAWRISDLSDGAAAEIAVALPQRPGAAPGVTTAGVDRSVPMAGSRLGTVPQKDGRASVIVMPPLGRVTPSQAAVLSHPKLVITPWRSIVVPDLTADQAAQQLTALRAAGLAVDADSSWLGVSACAGKPGCARALSDVRADAAGAHGSSDPNLSIAVHWVGCERRCGQPAGDSATVLATRSGYQVSVGAQSLDVGNDPLAVSKALLKLSRTR